MTDPLVRTLLALIAVHRRDGRATVHTVAVERHRAVSVVHGHLCRLSDAGLVAWEKPGALRPLVRRVQ